MSDTEDVVARVAAARAELEAATRARDADLVDVTDPNAPVPLDVAEHYGMSGREAASVVRRARQRIRGD